MANLIQYNLGSFNVSLDGTTAALVVDTAEMCQAVPFINRAPQGIAAVSISGISPSTYTLSEVGTRLVFNFTTLPPAGLYGLSVQLFFDASS